MAIGAIAALPFVSAAVVLRRIYETLPSKRAAIARVRTSRPDSGRCRVPGRNPEGIV